MSDCIGAGARRDRNAGAVGLRRGRQVDGQGHQVRALGQAQHRLPVAVHRHRALGLVAARADPAQRGELAQVPGRPALPGEDSNHWLARAALGRVEPDGHVDVAVARAGGDDGGARPSPRCAAAGRRAPRAPPPPPARRPRSDRGQRGALALGHGQALAHARAEHAAGERGGQGEDDGRRQHRRGPRMGHPHVAPAPLGREADGPDAQPAEQRRSAAARAGRRAPRARRPRPRRGRAGSAASCSRRPGRRTAPARRGSRRTWPAPGRRPSARGSSARTRARRRRRRRSSTGW